MTVNSPPQDPKASFSFLVRGHPFKYVTMFPRKRREVIDSEAWTRMVQMSRHCIGTATWRVSRQQVSGHTLPLLDPFIQSTLHLCLKVAGTNHLLQSTTRDLSVQHLYQASLMTYGGRRVLFDRFRVRQWNCGLPDGPADGIRFQLFT
jgi:hypothetical protein